MITISGIVVLMIFIGLGYLVMNHLIYFIFGAYFKAFYNKEMKYWGIYRGKFEFINERGVKGK